MSKEGVKMGWGDSLATLIIILTNSTGICLECLRGVVWAL